MKLKYLKYQDSDSEHFGFFFEQKYTFRDIANELNIPLRRIQFLLAGRITFNAEDIEQILQGVIQIKRTRIKPPIFEDDNDGRKEVKLLSQKYLRKKLTNN